MLFKRVGPETVNVETHVVAFVNIVAPDTLKDEIHVVALLNVVTPDTFNELLIVDAPETNKLVKLVLFNNDVLVEFKLSIFNLLNVDNEFKLLLVAYTDKSGLFVIAL